jgi:hypothetical protein
MSRCIAFAFLVLFVGIAVAEEVCPEGSDDCQPEDKSSVLNDDNIMLQTHGTSQKAALLQEKRAAVAAMEKLKAEEGEEDEEEDDEDEEEDDHDLPNSVIDAKSFAKLDTDGSGSLSIVEFEAGVKKLTGSIPTDAAVRFTEGDTNGDHMISKAEFIAAQKKYLKASAIQGAEKSLSNRRRRRWWGAIGF